MLTLFWFLVALGILVTFHEFGHFYVARRMGVKVLRFSIGFGKPFVTWRDKLGTEFAIAAIPLGGYVKMLDEREGPVADEELQNSFTRKSVWARIAIVAAGPLANFVLAVLLFWVTFMPARYEVAPVVGSVMEGSVADQAGLEAGQEIIAVDGKPTPNWQTLSQALLHRLGESGEIVFTVKYPDSDLEYLNQAYLDNWLKGDQAPDPFKGLGLELFQPKSEPRASGVVADSPAAAAGVVAGDLFVAANGQLLATGRDLSNAIAGHANVPITFTVLRQGVEQDLVITPRKLEADGESFVGIGIRFPEASWPPGMLHEKRFSVPQAFVAAVDKTWSTSTIVFVSIKKLIVGEISTKSLSGPFTIAKVAGDSAKAGWIVFVTVLASLSVNLAVLNLLPIPVLDGGHLLFYLIEAVKGKPVSQRVQTIGYQLGLFLVAGIMILAFYNDIVSIFQGRLFGLPT
ncbi:RIP metalloprotease RseP [Halioxenophilus sp. WMMB6]|uniref:RIP metalloprotease RseP n=1 Tax=Halioxenophilus sp. WMMB6 TaxID=3073815 RepID=UPI00295F09A3|nr:RIP metalloprotease RseP [Halioxenophilus sp. WMMB6]